MKHLTAVVSLLVVLLPHSVLGSNRFVVGVEAIPYLPHYTLKKGEYSGYAREILDRFAADQGIEFVYRPLPVKRLFQELVTGAVDFKYPDNPNWNRQAKADVAVSYSHSVAPYVDGVMVKPDRVGRDASEIGRLGTVRGFTPWAWMDRIGSGSVTLWENPDFVGLLRQGLAGRVGGVYANTAVANYELSNGLRADGGLVFDPALPHDRGDYQLSTTTRTDLMRAFNRWLETNADFVKTKQLAWGIIR
ncbi:MAG: transporter substrate-binding domain-containing protein [Pseudomonadota bacterium]